MAAPVTSGVLEHGLHRAGCHVGQHSYLRDAPTVVCQRHDRNVTVSCSYTRLACHPGQRGVGVIVGDLSRSSFRHRAPASSVTAGRRW